MVNVNKKYEVRVDDNYHYMDASERYTVGSYDTLEEAIERCKEITIKSLQHLYEQGMTPEKLHAQWLMFGEDPFILGGGESVPFSARKFISTELIKESVVTRN